MSKVKIQLALCLTKNHAMKTFWVPYILKIRNRWRGCPGTFTPGIQSKHLFTYTNFCTYIL